MSEGNLHPRAAEQFDASDPKQVKKREAAQAFRESEQRKVLKELLDKPAGRAWLWDLLVLAHVFETSFSENPHRMAWNEGERNLGLRLLTQITTVSPDAFVQMMRENGSQ
jgi:hypothetical protein